MKTAMGQPRGLPGILEFPCSVLRLPNGNTLVADAGDEIRAGSEVLEIDPVGKIVWNYSEGLLFAHSADRLPNGNTLIADTTNDRVIEVTPDKKIAFSTDDLGGGAGTLSDGSRLVYPNTAWGLEDGTFLITDRNNDRCLIINREGEVLWSYSEGLDRPHNTEMLDNGNFIIADSDHEKIVEVTRDGKVVWSYGDGTPDMLSWPRHARRLPDGNTLITDSKHGRVFEVTPDGKTVWTYQVDYFSKFYAAEKLENGNVLISDQQHHQLIEVDAGGSIVWMFRNYIYPNLILPRLRNGSFKERSDDGWPADWILARRFSEGGGELIWDEDAQPRPAPGIAFDRSGAVCIQQTVRVKPGTTYHFAGNIRTEELDGYACFQMAFVDALGGALEDAPDIARGGSYTGTTDWTQDTFQASAPERATAMEVRLFVTGSGKAWMKGIMVHA